MHYSHIPSELTRREFMQATGMVAGSFVLNSWASSPQSRVIEVHRPGIVGPDNLLRGDRVQDMLDRAMSTWSGESKRRDQWRQIANENDVVGIKANGLGGPYLRTKPELIQAVIRSLLDAGVRENNIIVFDNTGAHVNALGLGYNDGETGVRVYGSDADCAGYDETEVCFGAGSTRLGRILTQQITVLINMPVLKDHKLIGATVSLKNISHGITHNPGAHHLNRCDPFIAEINNLPAVNAKHRLVIVDALQGCCDGGPGYTPGGLCNFESIYISDDRVAVDTICSNRIESARHAKELPGLAEDGRPPDYLLTAERLGLGRHELTSIRHITVDG